MWQEVGHYRRFLAVKWQDESIVLDESSTVIKME